MASERTKVRSYDGFQFSIALRLLKSSLLRALFVIDEPGPLVLIDVELLEVLEEENDEFPSALANTTYQVIPKSVVDEEDPIQYAKYFPEPNSERRPIELTRIASVRQAARRITAERYRPLHPAIYTLNEAFLDPALVEFKRKGDVSFLTPETNGLYSGNFFTLEFCRLFVEEVEHFENSGLPVSRPNSMNNFGVILQDIGLGDVVLQLLTDYLAPLMAQLYPGVPPAQSLDSLHSFVVQYKLTEDRSLDFHYDDSHVTANICLGREFTGGDLYFRGLLSLPETHNEYFKFTHQPGKGCIHLGQHRHGAEPITSGERYNLIIWCRSNQHYGISQQHNHDHNDHEHHHDTN